MWNIVTKNPQKHLFSSEGNKKIKNRKKGCVQCLFSKKSLSKSQHIPKKDVTSLYIN